METKIFIPAEWQRQSALWLTWPSMSGWWRAKSADDIASAFASLAALISNFELVRINCPLNAQNAAKVFLQKAKANFKNIEFFDNLSDDVWCRDSGAIFRINNANLEALDFKYNAWGGKFPPWDNDDKLASKMAASAGVNSIRIDEMICEGGALEFDGKGLMMTTDCVVLNPSRNPKLSRLEAENIFKKYCGVSKVIWLKDGLFNDDTDGHIDNIARFTPNGEVLAAFCNNDNPSYTSLNENLQVLKNEITADIVKLPVPDDFVKHSQSGKILPASYANYLVINDAVIVPSYAQKYSDDRAKSIISDFFKGREIVNMDCRLFIEEGGAVHCLTQQQPIV